MDKDSAYNFCTHWLAAWTGNDPDKLMKFYAMDAYYLDPANPKGLNGSSEIFPYFRKLLARNPDWKWDSEEIFSTLSGFVLKWRAVIPTSSGTIQIKGLDIVEIREELITRNEVYFDRLPLQNPNK